VQDISAIYLHILNIKFGLVVYEYLSGVVFLTSLFGVEICLVKNNANLSVGGGAVCARVKRLITINGHYMAGNIPPPYTAVNLIALGVAAVVSTQ